MFHTKITVHPDLTESIKAYVSTVDDGRVTHMLHPPKDVLDDWNKHLTLLAFPPVEYLLLFNFPAFHRQPPHIDGSGTVFRKAALNFNLNEENAWSTWYKPGRYQLVEKPSGVPNFHMDTENLEFYHKGPVHLVELYETDIPHSVFTESKPVQLASLRFEGNPSFSKLVFNYRLKSVI